MTLLTRIEAKDANAPVIVLFGGNPLRRRIRDYVRERLPGTRTTEPGWDYPYENGEILAQVRRHLAERQSEVAS